MAFLGGRAFVHSPFTQLATSTVLQTGMHRRTPNNLYRYSTLKEVHFLLFKCCLGGVTSSKEYSVENKMERVNLQRTNPTNTTSVR